MKEAITKGTLWGLRREARKPGSTFLLKGGTRPEQPVPPRWSRIVNAGAGSPGARRAVQPAAAAAVHDRLRDARLGDRSRRRAAGQLPALGRRRPRDGPGHESVSGATGHPPGAQGAAGRRPSSRGYVGPWLPEPLLLDDRDASADVVLAESVSMAMLVLLETLGPDERAVFVLREVFDSTTARSPRPSANPRSRYARWRTGHVNTCGRAASGSIPSTPSRPPGSLSSSSPRPPPVTWGTSHEVAGAPDVTWTADGGGRVGAARRPITGVDRLIPR